MNNLKCDICNGEDFIGLEKCHICHRYYCEICEGNHEHFNICELCTETSDINEC